MLATTGSLELAYWDAFLVLEDERDEARMAVAVNRGFGGGG